MTMMKYASLFLLVSVCFGCTPLPRSEQSDFCYSDFAFEAEIKSSNIGEISIKYGFVVNTVYKGAAENIPSPLVGQGTLNSCGPQMLDLNTKYLIFAKNSDAGNIEIVDYKRMVDVKNTDIERMTTKYDCSCTINIDYGTFFGAPRSSLPEPQPTECNTPDGFCSRSGYCQKNSDGVCTWGDHGDCY